MIQTSYFYLCHIQLKVALKFGQKKDSNKLNIVVVGTILVVVIVFVVAVIIVVVAVVFRG